MRKPIQSLFRAPPLLPVWSYRRDRVSVPTICITLALSLILHIALLWKMPQLRLPPPDPKSSGLPLTVRLTPPPAPPRARARPPPEEISKPAPTPRAAERPRPERQPPVVARRESAPRSPPPPPRTAAPVLPPSDAAPAAARQPPAGDLASYVEAQRRARGASAPSAPAAPSAAAAPSAPPVEDANARANRIAAANLGVGRKPAFGPVRRSGGIFDVTHTGYDYAEFWFYGWNKDIERDTAQKIEVRKGSASDIRIAVVRRMIAIIRDHEREDFTWESHRLDRVVTLSARLRDNAGLEAFLMREFYEDPRRPASR